MPSEDYWKARMESVEDMIHTRGMDYTAYIDKQFGLAERAIQRKIDYWYNKLAENNEITLEAAKKLLREDELEDFHLSVEEYIEKGKTLNYHNTWQKQLENASAKVHISRLEAMKMQMQQECEVLYGNLTDGLDDTLRDMYVDGYYHTAYEIQRGLNLGWSFNLLDAARIEKAINTVWTNDGKNYTARCWANKQKLINELNTVLVQNIIRGESPQRAIDQLRKRMKVSRFNAGRLIMTESSFIYSQSQKDCFKELDVEQYEFVATLDNSTSETCRRMDGKVLKMSDYKIGLTAPPLHCFCRSVTVPYFDDDVGERIARGQDGKTYYVPNDMTYKEWDKTLKKPIENDDIEVEDVELKSSEMDNIEEQDNIENVFGRHVHFKTGRKTSKAYAKSKEPLGNFMPLSASDAVNVLYRNSRGWYNGLSDIERAAITKYTYNAVDGETNKFYMRLNAMLRGDIPKDPVLERYANIISKAINKTKLPADVICYRRSNFNPAGNKVAGEFIVVDQFFSTSVVESSTLSGKIFIKIYAKKGTHGAYIERLSHFKDQREVLLDKGLRYRVISNKGNFVELEVV